MAWRVRKSVKFGPLRFTLSNGTVSASVGSPVGRVSINTRGQVRTTERIPGTGIYNTKVVSLNKGARRAAGATAAGAAAAASNPGSHELAPNEFHIVSHTGSLADFPASGWFEDPLGGKQLRLWNGKHWQTDLRAAEPTDANTSLSQFPPEGWYPDPDGAPTECYWFKNQWSTAHREPGDATPLIGSHAEPVRLRFTRNGFVALAVLVVAIVLGMNDLLKRHDFWLALGYSLLSYPGVMLVVFGFIKGVSGRPTWLNIPGSKQVGWVVLVVGVGLFTIAGWVLPKP